jgi:molecular chaperone DnaK (HSP70)
MKFVGIDVGKQKCAVAVMDSEDRISDEFAIQNNHEGIKSLISSFPWTTRLLWSLRAASGQPYTTA